MFELFVVACVAARACEYITAPLTYPTEARCAEQAAILAGMVRARHSLRELSYEYTCSPTDRVRLAGKDEAPSDATE